RENGVQYGDLPEFLDWEYTAQVARVNASALAMLALAPPPPASVNLVTRGDPSDTTLRWSPGAGEAPSGYEVVWRDTTAPRWTGARFVGDALEHTLRGLSRDGYFFGVRAVDREGNRSVVRFPRPAPGRGAATE